MHANFTSTALRTLARLQFQCLLAYGVQCVWNGVSPWLKETFISLAEIFPKWKAKFRVPSYAEVDVRQQEQLKAISGKASMKEISILKIRSRIKIGGTGRGKKENKGICGLDWDGIL
ncbi:hypothetical protein T4B_6807 [Trichinella pseudospiralis]|uniref:Uncharacterized protein n=1 Tax=Trichinella pseudospiralis TaxID=6337 RepID=A0A0V1IJV0_TRIPS|nr:hypothetical protein T4B_11084 [Trichinella pseudospiralis]KRZ22772.1 hypothetical protein T4B_6807 [Trichinella pseudospiralis]